MYEVWFQDYRGWRETNPNQPYPAKTIERFDAADDARARAVELQHAGFITCVVPTRQPRANNRKKPGDKPFCADWKLHE